MHSVKGVGDEEDDERVMAPPFTRGLKLASGAVIPAIGLGVYKTPPGSTTQQAVLTALQCGYRHIDTAQLYQNEADVGEAIIASTIPRKEIFITTKLWASEWGYEKATAAIHASLARLQTNYIDLLLLHAPGDPGLRAQTWAALEDARDRDLVRDIGVSNFGQPHLEKLLLTARYPPAVNQIEVHPFLQRRELVDYCQNKLNMVVEAYSPLAKAKKLQDPIVEALARRLSSAHTTTSTPTTVTPAQVLLAWGLSKKLIVLPKSVHPERQLSNLGAANVVLSDADVKELDTLDQGLVTGWDPITTAPV